MTAAGESAPQAPGRVAAGAWKQEAGRLAAMVAGLNAIVWERDPESGGVRWVNDRIAEVLGYPVAEWYADDDLWPRVLHPADRNRAVAVIQQALVDRQDFALGYRVMAADGRVVWLHHFGHVAVDDDGRPEALHAVIVDVTAERRREQAARVSATTGSLLAGTGPLHDRLQAVADLLVDEVCDQAAVWLRDDDGRHSAVAAAPASVAAQILPLAPVDAPPEVQEAYGHGEPLLLPAVTDDMVRAATVDHGDYTAVRAAVPRGALLVVPLRGPDGGALGVLTTELAAGGRRHDDEDLALAADLGRRLEVTVAAERTAQRQQQLQALSVALSAAGTVAEVAEALAGGVRSALAASVVTVCTIGEDGQLHPVETLGFPSERMDRYATVRLTMPVPLARAALTRSPQWLRDRAVWAAEFPTALPHLLPQTEAAAALPLVVGDRVVGAIGVSFRSPRSFDAGTRTFLLTLANQAAVAFERAALADARGQIAETLQRSLLPRSLPQLDRLAVAARYLPGVLGTSAGGDWYDVLPREDGRVALAVGDVVGEGAPAAAVMGQLRSALAGYLLEGHEPAPALDLLDRFARSVSGAAVSTVTCLLLDPETGALLHASAGHPPPLVLDVDGARYLTGAEGPALALLEPAVHRQARATLPRGSTLLLYTDGLVEQRRATLDEGMARLASVAVDGRGAGPDGLVDAVLRGMVGGGRQDDVALVAARLVPARLQLDLVADAARMGAVRAAVRRWSVEAALDQDTADDLLLAVGEATANAVEHAYGGSPGPLRVSLSLAGGDRIEGAIADEGRWRPAPDDPGFRGRGLRLLRRLTTSVDLDRGPGGTVVRFRMGLPAAVSAVAGGADDAPAGPAAQVVVTARDSRRSVGVTGDLDLAGVAAVRDDLVAALGLPGPVVLDLTGLTGLSSSGLGLLLEAAQRGSDGPPVEVVLPDAGPARRLLDLTGLADALRG